MGVLEDKAGREEDRSNISRDNGDFPKLEWFQETL